jgi:hypothetical protein
MKLLLGLVLVVAALALLWCPLRPSVVDVNANAATIQVSGGIAPDIFELRNKERPVYILHGQVSRPTGLTFQELPPTFTLEALTVPEHFTLTVTTPLTHFTVSR